MVFLAHTLHVGAESSRLNHVHDCMITPNFPTQLVHRGSWCRHEDLCVPSLTQVLLWCQAAVDTQAMVQGTAIRAKSQLQALNELLSAATVVCQEVATVTGMITQLQAMPDLACSRQDSSWTIDVLDLHVDRRV